MVRTVAILVLILGLQVTLTQSAAEAHVPPAAYLSLEITDEWTEVQLVVIFDVFQDWFGFEPAGIPDDGTLTPAQQKTVAAALRPWMRVAVDGLQVQGLLLDAKPERFEDHSRSWAYVKLRVRFPTQVPPQQVAFVWTRFGAKTDFVFDELDAELDAYNELYYPLFSKGEPEYIWHRPRIALQPTPVVLPRPVRPPHVVVPMLSAGLLLLLLATLVLLRPRPARSRTVLVLAAGLALAALFSPLARIEVRLPWGGGVERPADADALAIFASLHRGVYDALDGETEEEVYDDLAASVTDTLLPKLYLDINQSLILQNEGGAVAKVQKTEITETKILPDREAGAPWFKVRARWQVVGKVGHWGHTHQRINEYLADLTIISEAGRWKIARIDVLDETRIDDGQKVR